MPEEIVFPSDFGLIRLLWVESGTGAKVTGIVLPGDRSANTIRYPRKTSGGSSGEGKIDTLVRDIRSFLSGHNVVFGTDLIDLDRCRPFQKRVLLAEYAIPRGYMSTYGRIARHLGVPGGARAVGNALARNPFPIIIPCHRALRSDGSLGGFQGGMDMKKRLLEMEGARFKPDGRVVPDHMWY
jgi:methylated-DNA-[protein]-cysteine S-methyltransferase